jgi:glycosyltransferase involved in cell wall biosynthesis
MQEARRLLANSAGMRIAIDARTLTSPKTGDRTVTLGFIKGLAALQEEAGLELALITHEPISRDLLPPARFIHHVMSHPGGYRWMLQAFPSALAQLRADVALIQYMGPFRAPCPIVTTIHDTVWRTMPKTFPWRDRLVLNAFIPGTIRRAAAITTGSEFARGEILRHYPAAAGKTHVVPYAADERFSPVVDELVLQSVRSRYRLPDRFILSVGVLQPRKNVEGLIRAYAMLPEALRREYSLVIAGKRGWLDAHLPHLAEQVGSGIVFTGYVSDDELPALYSLASCFAYPSFYEGFGLPPLEAMACGTPVVSSSAASLPEVTGAAALLADPDVDSLCAAITQVLTDSALREELRTKGLQQAARFSWTDSAHRLLSVLRQVTG